jgi:hypothetical protein
VICLDTSRFGDRLIAAQADLSASSFFPTVRLNRPSAPCPYPNVGVHYHTESYWLDLGLSCGVRFLNLGGCV